MWKVEKGKGRKIKHEFPTTNEPVSESSDNIFIGAVKIKKLENMKS